MHGPDSAADPEALADAFPELRARSRQAVLVRPRPGRPGVEDSSLGGPLLWPADEPWPVCAQEHDFPADPAHRGDAEELVAMRPVLQLRARDLPAALGFPDGADILQVLWCPNDHPEPPEAFGHHYAPSVTVRWRNGATGSSLPPERQPSARSAIAEYRLPPCELAFESVTDRPSRLALPDGLRDRFEEAAGVYYSDLFEPLRGIKLGGHEQWGLTDPFAMPCECGADLEHLLQIDSMPTEDLDDLVLGRACALSVYRCPVSTEHRHRINIQ